MVLCDNSGGDSGGDSGIAVRKERIE